MAKSESLVPSPWNQEQLDLIQEHRQYHYDMLRFIEELTKDGPTGKQVPKKPAKDFQHLLAPLAKSSNILSGKELHKYLASNLDAQTSVGCLKLSEVGHISGLENILEHLKAGYEIIKSQNSKSLCNALDYGEWLDVAFHLHTNDKQSGKVSATWKEWLVENVGIHDSYARKLRDIYNLFGGYTRFKELGLSFSEVYQRRKQIEIMLKTDADVAKFWKGQ